MKGFFHSSLTEFRDFFHSFLYQVLHTVTKCRNPPTCPTWHIQLMGPFTCNVNCTVSDLHLRNCWCRAVLKVCTVTEESPTGLEMFESVYVVPPCLNTVQCIFGCGSVIVWEHDSLWVNKRSMLQFASLIITVCRITFNGFLQGPYNVVACV